MQPELSFEVIVRKKIPYITSFLFHILMILGITLVVIDFFFLPSKNASDEMQVAYFILVIPDFIKNALIFSGVGFLITLPLYLSLRLYKKAILTFLTDSILIKGNNVNISISINTIEKVYCMDSKKLSGESKNKLTLYFQQKRSKTTRVRLKYYTEAENFMDQLMLYKNIDFKMYDFDVSPDTESEE